LAVDKVKPLGFEEPTDGTETFPTPTELDPMEDYIAVKGVAFENSETTQIRGDSGVMKLKDTALTEKTLLQLYGDGGAARYVKTCGKNGNVSSGTWLQFFASNPSESSPFVAPTSTIIKELSVAFNGITTVTFGVYKNAVLLDTIAITSASYGTKTGLSHSLVAGDKISVKTESGSASDPVLDIHLQTQV